MPCCQKRTRRCARLAHLDLPPKGSLTMLKLAKTDNERFASEVRHPLTHKDEIAVAAMRVQVAPSKGKMSGPEARPPFDELMEHVPDAPAVPYEQGVIGGVPGTEYCARRRCRSSRTRCVSSAKFTSSK